MPKSVSTTELFMGPPNVQMTLIETNNCYDDYQDTQRVEVKGDLRVWRRPKSAHPFVIDNLNHNGYYY